MFFILQKSRTMPTEQAERLLEIIQTKLGAFEHFIYSLNATTQSGVLELLGKIERPHADPLQVFKQKPKDLEWLRQNKNLILLSYNPAWTIKRITDTTDCFTFSESHDLYTENDLFKDVIQGDCCGSFASYENCWLVIVSVDQETKIKTSSSWIACKEVIRWKDLTDDARKNVLRASLKFHCFSRTLESFCQIICTVNEETNQSLLLNNLETDLIVQLLDNKEPQIAIQNIPKISNPHYLERKMLTRHRISRKVLDDTKHSRLGDVFLFYCKESKLKLYELESFVKKHGDNRCDRSSNQIKRRELSVRSILLENEQHFDEMCIRAHGRPVHLLSVTFEKSEKNSRNERERQIFGNSEGITELRWVKSHGSISNLQKYIHQTQDEIIEHNIHGFCSEESLAGDSENKVPTPVLISDLPGMGKSWLLCHCAAMVLREQEKLDSLSLVLTFLLPQFMEKVNQTLKKHSRQASEIVQDDIVEVLAEGCSNYNLGKSLLKALFEAKQECIKKLGFKNIRFEFFFDGLDELGNGSLELGKRVVELIGREIKFPVFVRPWIAVRPQHQLELEKRLQVLGYNIQKLDESDQLKLIVSYWHDEEVKSKLGNSYNARLNEVAKTCLENLKSKLSGASYNENITGLPLLCVYFAEGSKKHANMVLQEDNQLLRRLPDPTIHEIYQKYIEERFQYIGNIQEYPPFLRHMEKSLLTVFPETPFEGIMKIGNSDLDDDSLLQFGLLEKVNMFARCTFRHITLAEYLTAQSIVRVLKLIENFDHRDVLNEVDKELYRNLICQAFAVDEEREVISNVFKPELVITCFKFRYLHVCYFLNFSENPSFCVEKIFDVLFSLSDTSERLELTKKIWRRLAAAISANFSDLVTQLIQSLEHVLKDSDYNILEKISYKISDLVLLAAKYGDMDIIEEVLEFCKKLNSDPVEIFQIPETGISPVHIACESGNCNAVKYLLDHHEFSSALNQSAYEYLIYYCLGNSIGDRKRVIRRKEDILDELGFRFSKLFLRNVRSSACIVLDRIHFKLLVKYLCVKAAVYESGVHCTLHTVQPLVNTYGENIFHLLANGHYGEYLTAEEYGNAIKSIGDSYDDIFMSTHLKWKNQFGWRAADVAVSSLDLKTETLNYFHKLRIRLDENNVLEKSVSSQRKKEFLDQIIKRGAVVEQTILHVAAAKYNYSAVEYFVKDLNLDVNAKDIYGNTPLHMCFIDEAKRLNMDILDTHFNSYMESFENFKKPSTSASSSLDFHLRRQPIPRLEKLNQSFSGSITVEPEPNNQHKIIKFLIDKEAKISIPNDKGITPLDLAIDVCLGGLRGKDLEALKSAKNKLFEDSNLMTIALKGLLLNPILGDSWHPSLIFSFAGAIIKEGGNINITARAEKVTLLHLAARYHSYFGVKFLVENPKFSPIAKDCMIRDALEYMDCASNCYKYNCTKIREYLFSKSASVSDVS